ncbi:hypothetical protein SISNIDRAFT_447820 [Sistotremastrum niveocremeum HHB9708]|uniref:Cupredoxin n=1 Tax=Sistotremastrum niveocremeum HHB9708 TaxID=1314777 RepID=A0A165AH86_9AGAM|nr:hypothetical protein SISNIDRAFT_447820 [Sistotremastrum niveocremeum HHB9708]
MFASTTVSATLLLLLHGIRNVRAVNHQVIVGGPGILAFTPTNLEAAVGDTVQFVFQQKNHSATQSSFASPCVPIAGGFDTGFHPVPDTQENGPFPAATLEIRDTNPIWVFCKQANHCSQSGMVFAVNPGTKFAAFQAAATAGASTASSASSTAAATSTASASASTSTDTTTVTQTSLTMSTIASVPSAITSTATTTTTSSSVGPTTHIVDVGNDGVLAFSPSNITAAVGDSIVFLFHAKNHTATQSSFAQPCTPLAQSSTTGQVGFDSGFMPVASNATAIPQFVVTVNNTNPIWAFCAQTTPTSHCGQGMVFSANAVESGPNNFAAFQANAKAQEANSTLSSPSTSASGSSSSQKSSAIGTRSASGTLALVLGLILGLAL